MKRPTWLLLTTAVLLIAAAAPAAADGPTSPGTEGPGGAALKAMWMDATATIGDWVAARVRPDRVRTRDFAASGRGELGSTLDPDGYTADLGSTLDPDGYTADDGPHNDPDGNRSTGGPDLDPNG